MYASGWVLPMYGNLEVKLRCINMKTMERAHFSLLELTDKKVVEISMIGIMIQNLSIGATQSAAPDLFCGEDVCREAPEMCNAKRSHRKVQVQKVNHLFTGQNLV